MKKLRYLIVAFLAVAIFSCSEDEIVKLNDAEYVPATNIQGFGTTLALSKAKKADVIKVSYTPATYGVNIVKTHKLQFSTSTSFTNPTTFDVDAADNSFSFTVGALNEFITETLALPVDKETTIAARIMTYSLSGVDTIYSSPVNFKTTPYLDILFAPNTFYLFGDGVGRVAQNNKLRFKKVNSEEDVWTIVWMEATGTFKLCSDVNYKGVIGKIGNAVNGEYSLGTVDNRGEDIPVPGTAGYYTVGVNLATNKLLIEPASIYVCGPNVGEWPVSSVTPANKFKLDAENKKMYLKKSYLGGELRLHVTHPYISGPDWWHAEFIFFDGKIAYREDGGDQARVNINAGEQTIELDFINQTGKIK